MLEFQYRRTSLSGRSPQHWGLPSGHATLHQRRLSRFRAVAHGLFCSRDEGPYEFEETENTLTFNGQTITKPFVEKPVSGEDHDIFVYLHSDDGGGAQHLFRKRKVQNVVCCFH